MSDQWPVLPFGSGAQADGIDWEAIAWAYSKCLALGLDRASMESAMMMDRLKLMLGGYA
jgi:hypothetical protein